MVPVEKGGGKFKDFLLKFKTSVFPNSESRNIFRQSINASIKPKISKILGAYDPPTPGHVATVVSLRRIESLVTSPLFSAN